MGLPQILIGLFVAGLLATGFVTSLGGASDTAKVNNVKTFFTDGMNNAVTQCYLEASSFASCDKTKLIAVGKISTKNQSTEWSDTWTVAKTASKVTIVYPLDAADDNDSKGAGLASSLNASNAPITATYDKTTDDLTVDYSF